MNQIHNTVSEYSEKKKKKYWCECLRNNKIIVKYYLATSRKNFMWFQAQCKHNYFVNPVWICFNLTFDHLKYIFFLIIIVIFSFSEPTGKLTQLGQKLAAKSREFLRLQQVRWIKMKINLFLNKWTFGHYNGLEIRKEL